MNSQRYPASRSPHVPAFTLLVGATASYLGFLLLLARLRVARWFRVFWEPICTVTALTVFLMLFALFLFLISPVPAGAAELSKLPIPLPTPAAAAAADFDSSLPVWVAVIVYLVLSVIVGMFFGALLRTDQSTSSASCPPPRAFDGIYSASPKYLNGTSGFSYKLSRLDNVNGTFDLMHDMCGIIVPVGCTHVCQKPHEHGLIEARTVRVFPVVSLNK